jgi:4-carboxymuconolactone decarboxylase
MSRASLALRPRQRPIDDVSIEEVDGASPDAERYVAEFLRDAARSRLALDAKTRALTGLAAAAAVGGAPSILKALARDAVKAGAGREEIVAAIIEAALYSGFPAAKAGLAGAREAFAELDRRLTKAS